LQESDDDASRPERGRNQLIIFHKENTMSNIITLDGELRTDFGKGAARQARRAGKIPAVIYGHGTDPVRVLLPAAATTLAVRGSNALLNISVEGEDTITLVKDIQRHALRQTVDHLDLLIVKKGEKVIVEVSVQPLKPRQSPFRSTLLPTSPGWSQEPRSSPRTWFSRRVPHWPSKATSSLQRSTPPLRKRNRQLPPSNFLILVSHE
jgi:ribosomal protein L25 (general stress protein Ctc)